MSSVPPPPPPSDGGFNAPPPGGGFNAQPPMGGGGAINNNMGIAIAGLLGFFFCCLGVIPGVIAIIFANQSKQMAAAGDMVGAQSKANTAKILGIVGICLGALGILGNIVNFAVGITS